MASRKKSQGGGGLELVLIGAFFFLVYVVPALLALFWIITEIRTKTPAFKRNSARIRPTSEERQKIEKVLLFQEYIDNQISGFFRDGERAEIPRRQYDNLFDGHSGLGKKLNQQIEQAVEYRERAETEAAGVLNPLRERRQNWASRLAHRFAARWGIGIWFLTAQIVWRVKPDWHRPTAFAIASVVAMIATYVLIEAKRDTLLEEVAEDPNYESKETAIIPINAK